MSRLLGAPLAPAAVVAFVLAAAAQAHPLPSAALGAGAGSLALLLALASADGPRRILWGAVATAALGMVVRSAIAPPEIQPGAIPPLVATRDALAVALRAHVPEPESGILLGIVLGERASVGRDLRDAFAATGTAHLLAISGFNMTLVAAAVALALRGRVPPPVVAGATVAAVLSYSVLVGLAPSVARAAVMATVGALGTSLGRRGVAANALGAAVVVMLLADPEAIRDVGFLLSVAATAGLVAWQAPLVDALARLPSPVAHGLAATIAASAPTIPIVAATFGRISLVSPAANLLAVPLFAPIMLFGASTALVGSVAPSVAWPLAMAAYASTAALRAVVELGAAVPFASVPVPEGPYTGIALAAALAAAARLAPRAADRLRSLRAPLPGAIALPTSLPRPAALGVAAIVLVGAIAAATSSLAAPAGFRVRALDVGQGDAFLVETDGRYALIDGGPDPALLLRRLGAAMPPWHRRIELVALTHEHVDHGAGLLAVLDRYEVRLAIEPVGMNDVAFVRAWGDRLARAGVPRRAVAEGASVRLGRITLRILAPGRDRRVDVPSLVIRAEAPGGSVLFMGDATDDAVADLLLAPAALASRVYVPPHHGAASTQAAALVDAARPEAAVLSVGASNRYGHPAPDTLAALARIPVYRTDRHGTVEIELDGARLVVRTGTGLPPHRGGPLPSAPPAR